MSCHHHVVEVAATNLDLIGLLWLMFVTGLAGSFSHCIGMCGPIALAQLNVRLMKLPQDKISEKHKIKAAFLSPYYIGKATTYAFLTLITYLAASNLSKVPEVKYLSIIFLLVAGLFFIVTALNKTSFFSLRFPIPFYDKFKLIIANKAGKFRLEPFGFKGFILGMALGFIPCGLVYASIILAIDSSSNIGQAVLGMFVFGLATIPGLFISAYAGAMFFQRYRSYFNGFYIMVMLINSGLLFYYAYKQVKYLAPTT